jgi:hypothetical protein
MPARPLPGPAEAAYSVRPIDRPLERCSFLVMVRSQSRNCLNRIVEVRRLDRGLFHERSWREANCPVCAVPNGPFSIKEKGADAYAIANSPPRASSCGASSLAKFKRTVRLSGRVGARQARANLL